MSDDEIYWVAAAMALYDAAVISHPRRDGYQLFLFPRTLCRGQRLTLEPDTRKPRKPQPSPLL